MERLFALSLLIFSFTLIPVAEARLDDDLAALEKRFGEGKPKEVDPLQDRGLWSLFDSVLRFEKNGIVVTAGLSDEKCVAISYEALVTEDNERPVGMNLTEVLTLVAKNEGESRFVLRSGSSNGSRTYEREDDGAYAKTDAKAGAVERASFFSGVLFSSYDDFKDGEVSSDFLRSHPPRNLSDF